MVFENNRLEFTNNGKRVSLELFEGGHMLVNLEKVGEWTDEESIYYVRKETDVKTRKAVSKIHRILNHKREEQIEFAYRYAGKLDTETWRLIKEVVENCEICKKNGRSKSRPSVAIPRATDFNSVVTLDLKQFGNTNVLWMVCAFTKLIKGVVLKDKSAGLHRRWCRNFGHSTVGFYADNGGELRI